LAWLMLMLIVSALTGEGEYLIKPGDTLNIKILYKEDLSGSVKVSAGGYIVLPYPIGALKVEGLSADKVASMIADRLKEFVVNPSVFVSVTPAETFRVHVLGEVNSPSFLDVPEGTRLQEAITLAGGFTPEADLRHIKLTREDEGKMEFDFTTFIEKSDLTCNPLLKPGDTIIVPRMSEEEILKQQVVVIGAVSSPGVLRTTKAGRLTEILTKAGGVSPEADLENLTIIRKISKGEYSWIKVNLTEFLEGSKPDANPLILPGDLIFVPMKEIEKPIRVNVVGQVKNPASYPVSQGGRVFDAIYMAGGFSEDADITRVTIIQANPDRGIERANISLYLMTGDPKYNPKLEDGDTVFVPMAEGAKKIPPVQTAFYKSIRISIIGEVNLPGVYQISSNSSLLDVLKLAGGPTKDADLKRIMLIREKAEPQEKVDMEKVLTEGKFELMPQLQNNDTIFVPKIKEKPNIWRIAVSFAADISTILTLYLLILKAK